LLDLYYSHSLRNTHRWAIPDVIQFDKPLLDTFSTVEILPDDLDMAGRFTRQLAAVNGKMLYRLRGKGPLPRGSALSIQAMRREGSLRPCYNADRLGTEITLIGDGQPHLYSLTVMLSGAMELAGGPSGTAWSQGMRGMIVRGLPGTRLLTTDHSERLVLWIDGGRLERVLTALLDEPPRQKLDFLPSIDWASGPAAAVLRLLSHLIDELRDPNGLTSDPVALESFTDLLLYTVLYRLEHNYTARLGRPASAAIPSHLRRAEAFMHAMADRPVGLADVAAAAGCSLGTLQAAFQRFRGTTSLGALHNIRLQRVRAALRLAADDEPTAAIARRFGFTNPSRFGTAYAKRFGERPSEARQRRSSLSIR
jgi:AraC-like DNA-binding protein